MTLQVNQQGTHCVPAPVIRPIKRPRLVPRRQVRCTVPKRPAIKYWPDTDRPREKLLERGAQALSESELIALLLGSGTKGRSAVDIARALIVEFGSLREMMHADKQRWEARLGIGPARYAALMGAMEIGRRCLQAPLRVTSTLSTPEETREFLLSQLRDRHYEVFCCVFLDNRHRMLAFEEFFRGTIDGANVYPREIVRQTLLYNAASVIVVHNHPSGAVEPSLADEGVTRRLRQALSLIDVRLLDHFIVGEGKCYSFSEHGLL
ncbi:MAG: DNA repair protein RadC [Proteobacteria bacterium]|nr:DNA repair protein RadC [Pseudomonadota bacterium]